MEKEHAMLILQTHRKLTKYADCNSASLAELIKETGMGMFY